jgi:hypothetical protein
VDTKKTLKRPQGFVRELSEKAEKQYFSDKRKRVG